VSTVTITPTSNRNRTVRTALPMATAALAARLAALGRVLADDGPERVEDELAAVADLARDSGRVTSAADVLADRSAPRVLRDRAFGVVSAALVAVGEAPPGEALRAPAAA
jgi:hypothetical protein